MWGHTFFSHQIWDKSSFKHSHDLFVSCFCFCDILIIRLMFYFFENCNLFDIIPFACFYFAVPTNHNFFLLYLINFKQLICKLVTKLCLRTYFLFLAFIRFIFAEFYNIELLHWSLLLCNIMLFLAIFFCTKNKKMIVSWNVILPIIQMVDSIKIY